MADQPTTDNDMTQQVSQVIDQIRPMIQADGGDIQLIEITDEQVVKVQLQGACQGCPGAQMTLKMGVQRLLREKVSPQIEVVAV